MTRDAIVDFARLHRAAGGLPHVEAATRYDGTSVLRVDGVFMASLATHESAESGSIVVRCNEVDRNTFLEDAPGTYYVTGYYARYPLVLARLDTLDAGALQDLLAMSHRLTLPKTRLRQRATLSEGHG